MSGLGFGLWALGMSGRGRKPTTPPPRIQNLFSFRVQGFWGSVKQGWQLSVLRGEGLQGLGRDALSNPSAYNPCMRSSLN